jgi:hypothetical protein
MARKLRVQYPGQMTIDPIEKNRTNMKSIISMFVVGLLSQQIAQAQGTTYVSSLGLTPTGSSSVASDSWLAAGFLTGTNAGGYLLDSVQLALTNASGNPSGFSAMICSLSPFPAAPWIGSSLGTLDGSSAPETAGLYTYSPTSNLTLSPRTAYVIVLTAGTPLANGAYEWSVTSTFSPTVTGGWSAMNNAISSSDGLTWRGVAIGLALLSVSATPVPEPSTLALLALGGGFLLWRRRKAKRVDTA